MLPRPYSGPPDPDPQSLIDAGVVPACYHATGGLCPSCRADFFTDPVGWLEFGDHEAGAANWAALEAEMDAVPAVSDSPGPY